MEVETETLASDERQWHRAFKSSSLCIISSRLCFDFVAEQAKVKEVKLIQLLLPSHQGKYFAFSAGGC